MKNMISEVTVRFASITKQSQEYFQSKQMNTRSVQIGIGGDSFELLIKEIEKRVSFANKDVVEAVVVLVPGTPNPETKIEKAARELVEAYRCDGNDWHKLRDRILDLEELLK